MSVHPDNILKFTATCFTVPFSFRREYAALSPWVSLYGLDDWLIEEVFPEMVYFVPYKTDKILSGTYVGTSVLLMFNFKKLTLCCPHSVSIPEHLLKTVYFIPYRPDRYCLALYVGD